MHSQGWQWACGTRPCQICHSVSPWRCNLKGKKACFAKQQIKIALPIQHIHSPCVLKIHLLTAITGMRTGCSGMGGDGLVSSCAVSQTVWICWWFLLLRPLGSSRVGAWELRVMFSLQDLCYHRNKARKFSFPMPRAIFRVVCQHREISSLLHRWSGFARPWNYICMVTAASWILSTP